MGSASGPVNKQREKQACLDDEYMMYTYKNKDCPDGDKCPYAHNAFESWLHPDRYKTTLCSYAGACTRKFCFFAHAASELRTPSSKQQGSTPELRLAKTTSLDTNASVGTPNSSSISISSSSSSIAQSMQSNWTAATGSPMVGASHQTAATGAGRVYVNQLPQLQQNNILAQQGLANGMYLFPAGLQQQQQQLMATVVDVNGHTGFVPAGPPGLSAIMVTAPQLNAAGDAAAMPIGSLASATGAAGSGNIWDSAAGMALAANIYRAGSTPISMTDCSGSFAGGFMFDTSSPQTPLAVASMSPTQTPMVALSAMPAAAGNSGVLQLGRLQQALDASQQQHNGQLRQQLLQHLLTLQQQQQQQQDLQLSMNNWSLPAVGSSPLDSNLPVMLNANTVSLQQPSMAAAGSWPVMQLQEQQQLQASLAGAAAEGGVQVLSAPQLPGMAANAAAAAAASVAVGATAGVAPGAGNSQGLAGLQPTDASQLLQPFSVLSLAMPQRA